MKKTILLTVCILIYTVAMSQWADLSTSITGNLNAVYFSHVDTGIVVGETGIYKTSDGGTSWTKQLILNNTLDSNILENSMLNDVFYNNNLWYIVGKDTVANEGVILMIDQTTGLLTISYNITGYGLNGIGIANLSEIVAVGEQGTLLYSTNNGSTWISSTSGVSEDLNDIHTNGTRTYIGGDNRILYSTNFVSSGWVAATSDSINQLYVRQFYNQVVGVNSGEVLIGTWASFSANNNFNGLLNGTSISFNLDTEASIGTENGIYRSFDNSGSVFDDLDYWEKVPSSNGYSIEGLFMIPYTQVGYAVGENGLILKTTNKGGDALPYLSFEISGGCVDSTIIFFNNGPSSYTYTWKIDGNIVSNSYNVSTMFNSVGSHTVTLIASNGDLTDSLQLPFNVVDLPDTTNLISVSDSTLCKLGSANIIIHQSDLNTIYSLVSVFNNNSVDELQGNGSDLTLSTGLISDSTTYKIMARSVFADCEVFFTDSILIAVEHTKADFHSHLINADLLEASHFFNNSEQSDTYEWTFGTGASIGLSTSIEEDVSYNQMGQSQVTLISTSLYGCRDTLTKDGPYIYNAQGIIDNCWAFKFNSDNDDQGKVIKVDNVGDILVAGTGGNYVELTSRAGNTAESFERLFYLVKYSSEGVLKWMVKCKKGPLTSSTGEITDIITDNNGNVFVTGYQERDFTVYSNNGKAINITEPNLPNPWIIKGFVMKFDAKGVFQWRSIMSGPTTNGRNIDLDDAGNIYVSGSGSLWGYFISPSGVAYPKSSVPPTVNNGQFLLQMDSNGEINWVTEIVNSLDNQNSFIRDISTDSIGNTYLTGDYSSIHTFNSVSAANVALPVASPSYSKAYVSKYDSNGNVEWANSIYSTASGVVSDGGKGIVVDKLGNSYIVMISDANSPGEYVNFPSTSGGSNSVYEGSYTIASYDANGNFRWGTGAETTVSGGGIAISIDKFNNVYALGQVYDFNFNTVEFRSTDNTVITLPINGGSFFIAKYDLDGGLKWATLESGMTTTNTGSTIPFALDVNNLGEVYVTGRLSALNFLIASDTLSQTNTNYHNFIAKFSSSACLQPDLIQTTLPIGPYCVGSTISVPFNVAQSITILPSNVYELQLSDSVGSFSNPQVIGTLNSTNNLDTITGVIPNVFLLGNYYIRVVASLPGIVGNSYSVDIDTIPTGIFASYQYCQGDSLQLQSNNGISYIWQPLLGLSDSLIQSPVTTASNSIVYFAEVNTQCGLVNDTFNITVLPLPTVNLAIFNPDTICFSGSLIALPMGSPAGGNFSGNGVVGNNLNPASAGVGTHNIVYTYTDGNSCINTDTTIVTVRPLSFVYLATFNPDTICVNGPSSTLPIGTPTGGNYTGNGVVGSDFNPASAGVGVHNIIYSYTDANSCTNSDTTTITVDVCTGVDNISTDFGIIIYPNPSTGQFTIEKPTDLNKVVHVKLLDATSKLILENVIPIGKQKIKMDIRNYSKGIYYLHLIIDNEQFVKQILKN